jgi:hypothetical protein
MRFVLAQLLLGRCSHKSERISGSVVTVQSANAPFLLEECNLAVMVVKGVVGGSLLDTSSNQQTIDVVLLGVHRLAEVVVVILGIVFICVSWLYQK